MLIITCDILFNIPKKKIFLLKKKNMTTLVSILNKRAAVIAADSAVTFSNQTDEIKTYNSANKIFRLSEYHPVGIMIYNNAEFMGTPWDIIIKLYRKQLGKKNLNTLKDFVFDFKSFLYDNKTKKYHL